MRVEGLNMSLWLHCNCNGIDIRKANGVEQWDAAQAVGGGHAQRSFQLRVVKCVACGGMSGLVLLRVWGSVVRGGGAMPVRCGWRAQRERRRALNLLQESWGSV